MLCENIYKLDEAFIPEKSVLFLAAKKKINNFVD